MRKQYFFRNSPDGLLAWDVDRLVDLTRSFPRVPKALLEGHATINVVQFAEDPPPDFVGQNPDDLPY